MHSTQGSYSASKSLNSFRFTMNCPTAKDEFEDVSASLTPSKELLEAMNFALKGPSRLSYDPPIPSMSLTSLARPNVGILKDYTANINTAHYPEFPEAIHDLNNYATWVYNEDTEDAYDNEAELAQAQYQYLWDYQNYYHYYNSCPNEASLAWYSDPQMYDPAPSAVYPCDYSLLTASESPESTPPASPAPSSPAAVSTPSNSTKLFDAFMEAYSASFLAVAPNKEDGENGDKQQLKNVYAKNSGPSKPSSAPAKLCEKKYNDPNFSSSSDDSCGEGPIIEIRGRRNSTFRNFSKRGTKREFLCVFCKGNNESEDVYKSHPIRVNGIVMCPYLRNHVCALCKATGDNAHTIKYCPQNKRGFFAMKAIERATNTENSGSRKVRLDESSPFKRFQNNVVPMQTSGNSSRAQKANSRNRRRSMTDENIHPGGSSKVVGPKKNINIERNRRHFGEQLNTPYANIIGTLV